MDAPKARQITKFVAASKRLEEAVHSRVRGHEVDFMRVAAETKIVDELAEWIIYANRLHRQCQFGERTEAMTEHSLVRRLLEGCHLEFVIGCPVDGYPSFGVGDTDVLHALSARLRRERFWTIDESKSMPPTPQPQNAAEKLLQWEIDHNRGVESLPSPYPSMEEFAETLGEKGNTVRKARNKIIKERFKEAREGRERDKERREEEKAVKASREAYNGELAESRKPKS